MKDGFGVTVHVRERFVQHYGWEPTEAEWLSVLAAILNRTAVLVDGNDGFGGEKWAMDLRGRTFVFVWKPGDACIATVFPAQAKSMHPERRKQMYQRVKRRRLGPRPDLGWSSDVEAGE